tara:strand:- start:83 stop:499 length:417 start_codon:yes stop_codon:yes gene_type:complete
MKNLVLVLVTLVVFTSTAQDRKKYRTSKPAIEYSYKYSDASWNDCQLREFIIRKCSTYLEQNNLDILNPGYQEVQVTFYGNYNMKSLLDGKSPYFIIDDEDFIRLGFGVYKEDVWEMVSLEIESNMISFSVEEYRYEN